MDHPDYFAEPFTRMSAWMDMLLLANHSCGEIVVRGIRIEIGRGELAMSHEALAARWRWSRGRVSRYLSRLEESGQIVQTKSNVINRIAICNYDCYQLPDRTGCATKRTRIEPAGDTAEQPYNNRIINVKIKVPYPGDTANYTANYTADGAQSKEIKKYIHTQYIPGKRLKSACACTNCACENGSSAANELLDEIATRFPSVQQMPEPFEVQHLQWMIAKYSREDILRIVADMDNKGGTKNKSAYTTFVSYVAHDTILRKRREEVKYCTYEEMCDQITSHRAKSEDFERAVVGGRSLWKRKQCTE